MQLDPAFSKRANGLKFRLGFGTCQWFIWTRNHTKFLLYGSVNRPLKTSSQLFSWQHQQSMAELSFQCRWDPLLVSNLIFFFLPWNFCHDSNSNTFSETYSSPASDTSCQAVFHQTELFVQVLPAGIASAIWDRSTLTYGLTQLQQSQGSLSFPWTEFIREVKQSKSRCP